MKLTKIEKNGMVCAVVHSESNKGKNMFFADTETAAIDCLTR